jgi:glycogen synthase
MTRIALIPSSYPPSLGGVEELTRHLALSLVDAGDQVEVWTGHPDDSTPETAEIRDGMVVRRLPMPLPATNWSALRRSATTGSRTLFSLRSAAAAFRPDVLHVQCFGPNGTYATALSRITGIPLVISLQGETLMDDADIFETSRVLRASLRRGLRTASAVTGCSAFTLADAERRFGLAVGKGRVVPNGVDVRTAGIVRPSAGTPSPAGPGRPYVFALGRVVEKKGSISWWRHSRPWGPGAMRPIW